MMIDPTRKVGFFHVRLNTLFRYHSVPAFSTTKRILAAFRDKRMNAPLRSVFHTLAGVIVAGDNFQSFMVLGLASGFSLISNTLRLSIGHRF